MLYQIKVLEISSKKTCFFIIFWLIIFCTFAQNPQSVSQPIKKIKLSGRIIDNETKVGLEYATISLINKRFPNRIQGGITDKDGSFNLEVFPGKYNITFEYIGFDKLILLEKVLRSEENLGNIPCWAYL